MIPGRQMVRLRAAARAVAKNAGVPPEVFDKFCDEYERNGYISGGKYEAILARYASPELLGDKK